MGLLLIVLAMFLFGWMFLAVLSGAASLTNTVILIGDVKSHPPHPAARKRTRDRVLLVLLALVIVGNVMHFLGLF